MSATKEVKALLDELRGKLDKDQAAYLEPLLRKILDAAKPKTVTEVAYRSDPRDEAEIKSLHAAIASKEEAIRKLQAKLADRPPQPKAVHPPKSPAHLSHAHRFEELDNRAQAWVNWATECMTLMADNEDHLRHRKQLLLLLMRPPCFTIFNYLSLIEGLRHQLPRSDLEQLPLLVNQSACKWLAEVEEYVHAATGIDVDLELHLRGQDPLSAYLSSPENQLAARALTEPSEGCQ